MCKQQQKQKATDDSDQHVQPIRRATVIEQKKESPRLLFLVDELPEFHAPAYRPAKIEKDDSGQPEKILWVGECEAGNVDFFVESKKDTSGALSRSFVLADDHSEEVTVKGAWSGRPGLVNKHTELEIIEVLLTDDSEVFESGNNCIGKSARRYYFPVDIAQYGIKEGKTALVRQPSGGPRSDEYEWVVQQ